MLLQIKKNQSVFLLFLSFFFVSCGLYTYEPPETHEDHAFVIGKFQFTDFGIVKDPSLYPAITICNTDLPDYESCDQFLPYDKNDWTIDKVNNIAYIKFRIPAGKEIFIAAYAWKNSVEGTHTACINKRGRLKFIPANNMTYEFEYIYNQDIGSCSASWKNNQLNNFAFDIKK